MEETIAAVFRDKPEMVVPPEWMLPGERKEAYLRMKDLAIVEIAGRDSIAAAVSASAQHGYGNLLPVYAYTGSEHGSWENVGEAVRRLTRRLPDIRIHPLLVVGSPKFWRALNGRFVPDLIGRFGHYTPCAGCHLYLHAVRIPLAAMLGNIPIIGGERISHGGTLKINQVEEALAFYKAFAASFGIRLDLPLADVTDDEAISEILASSWERGKEQLECVFSGSYKLSSGEIGVRVDSVEQLFRWFAGPVAEAVIRAYLEKRVPDHEGIARRVIKGWLREEGEARSAVKL